MNKKFTIALGAFVVAAVAFSAQAAMGLADYTRVMKMGTRGNDVKMLQWALNEADDAGLPQTGYFWTKTKAAVINFQKSNGIKGDGVVGPVTYAKLQDAVSAPADDSSTDDSSTDNSSTDNSSTDNSSTDDSSSNNNTNNNTTVNFSGNDSGNLTSFKEYTGNIEDKVNEGKVDQMIYSFEFKAEDAAQKITNLNLKAAITDSSATKAQLSRYVSEISLWLVQDGNMTELARKSADDFSSDTNDIYSYNFSGLSAVVPETGSKTKPRIVVAVTPIASPSSDVTSKKISFWLGSSAVRSFSPDGTYNTYSNSDFSTNYTSAAYGVSTDYNSYQNGETFTVQSLTNSGTVKLNFSQASSSPAEQNVIVSTTAETKVLLTKFTIRAEGSDITLKKMPIWVTGSSNLADVANNLRLESTGSDTNVAASESLSSYSSLTGTVTFSDLDVKLKKDQTITFSVFADVKKYDTSSAPFAAGTTLKADYGASQMSASQYRNALNDTMTYSSSDFVGSIVGKAQSFYKEGVNVKLLNSVVKEDVISNTGATSKVTYTGTFEVTAFGRDFYFGKTAAEGLAASGTNAMSFAFENSSGGTTVVTSSPVLSSNADAAGSNAYRLAQGEDNKKTVTLTVYVTGAALTDNSYRVQFNDFRTFTDEGLTANAQNNSLLPSTSFETLYQLFNN